jgi:trehalose 6-phosphate synthase
VPHDLVIVANRLPVDRVTNPDGSTGWTRSPGGLVSAIEPVLRGYDGVWMGWPGGTEQDLEPFEDDGLALVPMTMSAEDVEGHYEGFSNGTLWPLYHDLVAKPAFHREWWESYVEVNERFAAAAAEQANENATVWVHDYQLQLVPRMLRELRPDLRIGFYLHIPFPPAELFQQLPWRRQILEGLLGADLVGFQLPGGAQNFVRLVRQRVGHKTHRDLVYLPDGRTVRAAAFPISIDAGGFKALATSPEAVARAEEIRAALGNPRRVFLGCDRLDYTKGIFARLRAFSELIDDGHFDVEDAVFVQVAVPSREQVEQYQILRDEIERLVGRINGEHGKIGRPAVHYLHTSLSREEMAAFYRTADVMVVTPYRDGMNLVAKEYVACRADNTGALVLSEFAGAADELRQAWLVNPYDINGMKAALLAAYQAEEQEVTRRMKAMRKQVNQHDVTAWADAFMTALEETAGTSHGKSVRPARGS